MKKTTAENLRDAKYYHAAHQGSLDLNHPAMQLLLKEAEIANSIVDLGCGEGTRLNLLVKNLVYKKREAVGVEINDIAISKAKKNYPQLKFIRADLVKIPLNKEQFDLAYSAYVFEHLDNPEQVIKEAARLLKKDGKLLIVAPNFGSPNRRSPNSKINKLSKLINGFILDLNIFNLVRISKLSWTKVTPMKKPYTIDSDTTVEPYLLTLTKYAKSLGFKVKFSSSNWKVDEFSLFQLPFKILAMLGIYPFTFWGPHLCVLLEK